ncbi:MAG: FAD-binding oxidoreductase [Gammaproteobacteria bacterium]
MDPPAGAISNPDLQALRKLLGAGGYLDSPADRAPFETDFRGIHRGLTPLVALPATTAQVAELVRFAAARRIALVPQGGNTSYCGGATPRPGGRDVVVSLKRMQRIRSLDAANDSLTADAGCVLAALREAAAAADRLLPMSLGSEGSCTLGGIVSTNAGGTAVLRYGMMRDLILGLEVVLPDGRVLDQLRGLRKDNTGYDVKQLFIGAEGTLGIVTAACLRLFPRPAATATAFVASPSPAAALGLLRRLRASLGDSITTFELVPRIALELVCRHLPGSRDPFGRAHPWYVLAEVALPHGDPEGESRFQETLAAAIEAGDARDAATAASESQREAFWRLRESIPQAQRAEGPGLKHDVSVEPARLPAFIEEGRSLIDGLAPGARLIAYGHLGDGNLHFNVSAAAGGDAAPLLAAADPIRRAIHELVMQHRGSISAEHGIGQLKVAELARYEDPAALDLMRRIKRAIDPAGIMNPGKILEDPA